MNSCALIGDVTTTTALAASAAWPGDPAPVLVECDPSGGSLAGWLAVGLAPSLSTLVTSSAQQPTTPAEEMIARNVQRSRAGVDVVVAPLRSVEAARSVAEAEQTLVAAAATRWRTMLFDIGRLDARHPIPATATSADVVVVVHRQMSASGAASAVRVERTSELLERLASVDNPIAVVVVGDAPFESDELTGFWERSVGRELISCCLPEDPLAAATLAGRVGVSQRRLSRLPLMRAAVTLTTSLTLARREAAEVPLATSMTHGASMNS